MAHLFEVLRYKLQGRGFDSGWCHSTGRITALGSTQSLNTNEYQEYFLGVKAVGVFHWQPYHLQSSAVLKSGILNLP